MKYLLFGGIGTLVNTSRMQFDAFNHAFQHFGVDWVWDESHYKEMLKDSGGIKRINHYARSHSPLPESVTAEQIHQKKTELFLETLSKSNVPLRPGVGPLFSSRPNNDRCLAFATTTYADIVAAILNVCGFSTDDFSVITHRDLVGETKPSPEVYQLCMDKLGTVPADCVAIEDSSSGLESALNAGLKCVAFPNEFTAGQDFSGADEVVSDLSDSRILKLV